MRWLDIGWEAHGVVAIGQFATGVVAIGQVAWGVVAIGQAAFGGLAVGQVAVGSVSVGMVGVGLHWTTAMIGVAGAGRGWIVPLMPRLDLRAPPSELRTVAELRAGRAGGWTTLGLGAPPPGADEVSVWDGRTELTDVRIDARCRSAALEAAPGMVWAHLRPSRGGWVADRLVRTTPARYLRPEWWLGWSFQLAGWMLVSAATWWWVVDPVGRALTTP